MVQAYFSLPGWGDLLGGLPGGCSALRRICRATGSLPRRVPRELWRGGDSPGGSARGWDCEVAEVMSASASHDPNRWADWNDIRCELVIHADSDHITVLRGEGCTTADVMDMCRLVVAGESVFRGHRIGCDCGGRSRVVLGLPQVPQLPSSRVPTAAVEVVEPGDCEVVIQGRDECAVMDKVATWVRKRYADIEIIGLRHAVRWEPDPNSPMARDKLAIYSVTISFQLPPMLKLGWHGE